MIKNPVLKNILSAVAVAGFGFILLNIAFIFDFIFQSLIIGAIKFFVAGDPFMEFFWFPPMMHLLFAGVIGLISWFVLKSKLRPLLKAIYMTVPLAVVFVTIGIFLYRWPIAVFSLSGLFGAGVLYYLYRAKQPWIYYYTVILVGLVLAIFSLAGGEI
jgi:hypothetical protein